MFYFIGWSLFLLFSKAYLKLRVTGRENVPAKGAFIFASNHCSFLDPILLSVSLHRSLNFMARDTLFKKKCFAWILRNMHAFPVKRHGGDFKAIKESFAILKRGKPLVIFPEGTRSKDRELKKGKAGVGFIVAKSGVPVIPAYVEGSFDALPRRWKTLKRRPVEVHIGRPVDLSSFSSGEKNQGTYQLISDEIMCRIAELKLKAEKPQDANTTR